MKELSIEEKAKRYDEAIEKLRSLHDDYDTVSTLIDIKEELENIFPELKVNEDEKIRKFLIYYYQGDGCLCTNKYRIDYKEIRAWLEKQGEQKPTDTDNKFIRMRETKPKDISEFLDRLTTVEQEFLWEHIAKIRELDKEERKPAWSEEDEFHLKSIESTIEYCKREVAENDEARYVFNEDLNWLKSLKERVQPKQEWSEEDIVAIDCAVEVLSKNLPSLAASIAQLKTLRPQNTWKPSDEMMKCLDNVKGSDDHNGYVLNTLYNDLKKLKEE